MLALTHADENIKSHKDTTKKLTGFSFFTRLISPVVMRAANATQSASETPQPLASISSLSTSNSLLPNFTVGMEHAEAAVRLTLRPGKCGGFKLHLATDLLCNTLHGLPRSLVVTRLLPYASPGWSAAAAAAAAGGGAYY